MKQFLFILLGLSACIRPGQCFRDYGIEYKIDGINKTVDGNFVLYRYYSDDGVFGGSDAINIHDFEDKKVEISCGYFDAAEAKHTLKNLRYELNQCERSKEKK